MAHKPRDLCGIMARGETLSWRGGISLISFQFTTHACPDFVLSWTLPTSCFIALGFSADE